MADDCDITACCNAIQAALETVSPPIAQIPTDLGTTYSAVFAEAQPLLNLINWRAGGWIPTAAGDLPSLAEIVQRIANFGAGWAEWSFWEYDDSAARTAITLPATFTGPVRVRINSVPIPPSDYSLVTNTLTLDDALEHGDQLTIKSYGA